MSEIKKDWICNGIAGLLLAIAWYVFTKSKYNGVSTEMHNYNIMFYTAAVAAFIAVWMLLRIVIGRWEPVFLNNRKAAGICAAVWVWGITGILLWNYVNEGSIFASNASIYIRHSLNEVFIAVTGLAFPVFLYFMEITFKNNLRYLLAAGCSFIVVLSEYTPNPFYDTGGGLYHYDAYTTSIFNALNGAPFSDINISIYGHHSMIYYPFVKICGRILGAAPTISAAVVISFFSMCTILFMSLAGLKMIKDDKIFLLYEFALFFLTSAINLTGVYFQLFPHRCLFPALMLYLCSCINGMDTEGRKYCYLKYAGWIIIAFALIWNFETGIVCAISYGVYLFLREAGRKSGERLEIRTVFKCGIATAVSMSAALILSYCILNVYNLWLGGRWLGVLDYIYPIRSDKYLIDNLIAPIQPGLNISLLITLAFLAACCMAARKFFMGRMEESTAFLCMAAVNGMGVFLYFINRAAYGNISISFYQLILLIGVTADLLKRTDIPEEEYFIKGAGKYSYCLLFGVIAVLAVEGLFYMGAKLCNKKNSSWKTNEVKMWKGQISSAVPKDTPAIGAGVNALYGYLGWDTKYHITDWPDFTRETVDYVLDEIPKLDAFFANEASVGDYAGVEFFQKTVVAPIRNDTYVYYTRRERPEYALGSRILFCADGYNADTYVLKGITAGTERYSWTENNLLKMWMSIQDAPEMMHMVVELDRVYNSEQNVSIAVNGEEVYSAKAVSGNNIEFDFKSNGAKDFIIEFNLPDAVTPASLGESDDARYLALGIISIVIDGK